MPLTYLWSHLWKIIGESSAIQKENNLVSVTYSHLLWGLGKVILLCIRCFTSHFQLLLPSSEVWKLETTWLLRTELRSMEGCRDSYSLEGVEKEDYVIMCPDKKTELETHQFEESEENNITAIGVKRNLLRGKEIS